MPDYVWKRSDVCGAVRGEIEEAAHQKAINHLGIVVTQQDIDAARASTKTFDPVEAAKRTRENAALIFRAYAAVDQGQDPHEVWEKILKPSGMPEDGWKLLLQVTPSGRKNMEKQLTMTPEQLMPRGSLDAAIRRVATRRKLDAAVDQLLSENDPTFRHDLEKQQKAYDEQKNHAVPHDPGTDYLRVEDVNYLNRSRGNWWKSFTSTLDVRLNDPTLAQTCHLDGMGVKIQ